MPLKPASAAAEMAAVPPQDFEQLRAALDAPDPILRRQAAQDLAGMPGAEEILCQRLEREQDVAVWDAILTSLVRIGGSASLQGLLRFLRAEPVQLRNEVLEALKTFPEQEILPHIEALLTDPDPHLRIAVIHLIQALGYPVGVNVLTTVLDREEHLNVAATAVELLAEIGTPEAVPALQRTRARFADTRFMTFAVDTALARICHGETE